QQAENEKQSLLQLVRDKTQLWDSQLRLGIISDENKQKLTEWMLFAQKVESTDTFSLPVTFPEQPE
ncbi:TPA: tail fiber assembly protein, partial [Escherichia coli]